jgi:hypothetical protein
MSRLAEEIVEEWLNRHAYFTIRGLKIGVDEIDLLAIKPRNDRSLDCRHIEVQASSRPVSYISRVPKEVQKRTGRAGGSAKRSKEELKVGVKEWVDKKFLKPNKARLMSSLAPGPWTKELVVHVVKLEDELRLIEAQGIIIHRLAGIIDELNDPGVVYSACGGDLLELVQIGSSYSRQK